MNAPNDFFVWGEGGRRLTPEEIAQERKMALALQQPDFSPAGSWMEVIGRGLSGFGGGLRERRADDAAAANASDTDRILRGITSPSSVDQPTSISASPAPTSTAGSVPAVPGDLKSGIAATAEALGIDPVDLATAISYETGGTFDPTKAGPTTQWGQHRGLIQFGEPQAQKYGVDWNNPVGSQLGPDGAVARYLRDTGVKPGMGLMDIYSAINAGGVGRYDRSDANNGGAPGTVADKVNNQMAGHRQKALALFGGEAAPVRVASSDPNDFGPVAMALAQSQPQRPPNPVATALAQAPQQATPPQINPAIMEALTSPYVSRDVKALAGSMLQQQMRAQQQANDPLRRLQLERAELENERLRTQGINGDETFYGNPIAIQTPNGVQYGQIGNKGTFRPIDIGQGNTFAPNTRTVDTGTELLTVGPGGEIMSRTPKDIAGAESAKVQGKAQGEARANLPTDISTADRTLKQIDELLESKGLPDILGPLDQYRGSFTLGKEGNDALSRYNQLKGTAFLQAYGILRGGGQVTEVEGAKAEAAMARMDRAQDEETFKASLRDFRDAVATGLMKMRERAGVSAAPPAAGEGTSGGLKSKYGLE